MSPIITTERLILCELVQNDFIDLCEMLQDIDVVSAWEHTFTEEQVQEWLEHQFERYETKGVGLWAVIEKETGKMVGQMGLVWSDIEGEEVLELAYMLKKVHWGRGFAIEGGATCLDYALNEIGVQKVYIPIRPENQASKRVAEKLGFSVQSEYIKHYNGKDMVHLVYVF
jgi:RimJ/RimL family protein N-acetyltransferase